jgi:surface polysaccharide O-acyltransferase-like enzyme
MWFLFMIVGLYMIVPFLRKIVESEGLTKYFLVLALIFASILPQLLSCLALIIPTLAGTISQMLGHMQFHFAMGYAGYFVLGYQLHKMEISKKTEWLIYGLGIFGVVMTAVMTDLVIVGTMQRIQIFYDYFTVNVLLQSIAVFVWMKKHAPNSLSDGAGKLLRKLSKYSFGAYLVHVMVIAVFKRLGLQTFSFNAWVSVPVISILVFAVSMGISAVINHIPILKKYIV